MTPSALLFDDDHLAVLQDPPDEIALESTAGFGCAQRAALGRQLIEDHRVDASVAYTVSEMLLVEPAHGPWPEGGAVVALAEGIGGRLALDRSTALCVAVAVTRRLSWQGMRPVGLDCGSGI